MTVVGRSIGATVKTHCSDIDLQQHTGRKTPKNNQNNN